VFAENMVDDIVKPDDSTQEEELTSLQVGGLLHVSSHAPSVVLHVLVSIMLFYSKIFLLFPLARLGQRMVKRKVFYAWLII